MSETNSVIIYNLLIFMIISVNSEPHHIEENSSEDSISYTSNKDDFRRRRMRKRSDSLIFDQSLDIEDQIAKEMLSPLNASDFKRAKLLTVEDFQPMNNLSTILNNPSHFEGDIEVLNGNGILDPGKKWPKGRIPYVLSSNYSSEARAKIARAFQEYHYHTCIRFMAKTDNDMDYIYILPLEGCSSSVGRVGGMQQVSIGEGCDYVGIIVHELMHAIGFWHEQSRVDRDDYVRVIWNNIPERNKHNFRKYTINDIQDLGECYDYTSVMHYGPNDFSATGEPTIVPLTAGVQIGQRYGLSETDIRKINKLYNRHN